MSTMMGSLNQMFIVIMAMVLVVVTAIGIFVIYKVAPIEQITYEGSQIVTRHRRKARRLCLVVPVGLVLALLIAPQFGLVAGASVAFLIIGVALLPAGFYALKDDSSVNKVDDELAMFLRSMGNVAGSTGITLTESLKRIDKKSMGSLEPHIERLHTRLAAGLPVDDCWEAFRAETGSELVNRGSRMLVDGSGLGGMPERVGEISSSYVLRVTQLRAKRKLTASTFTFLTIPMHATMTFILMFVLEIITNFNTKLSGASGDLVGTTKTGIEVPSSLQMPPGVSLPAEGDLTGGLDIFDTDDMGLATMAIVFVVAVLTVANALAPKFAAGGSNLKILPTLGVMCLISGFILGVVPKVTGKIFDI